MMEPKIGLQMWSVRSAFAADSLGTLEKIAEIGYKDLQVNSFEITPKGMLFGENLDAAGLQKQMERFGLRAVSAHFVPTPDMNLDAIANDLKTLGVDNIAIAIYFWANAQEVHASNHQFNQYAEAFKKHGIELYYHNHFHEFQVFGEKSIFEMMIEGLDKDLVKFEFDTFWAARGGQDPIYWLKKLGRRCDLIHQKDMPANANPVNFFEMFGYDSHLTIDAMWKLQDPIYYTEVGEGVLNIPGIIQAARSYNQAKYIFVEQDMSSNPELESVALSLKNMTRLMAE